MVGESLFDHDMEEESEESEEPEEVVQPEEPEEPMAEEKAAESVEVKPERTLDDLLVSFHIPFKSRMNWKELIRHGGDN